MKLAKQLTSTKPHFLVAMLLPILVWKGGGGFDWKLESAKIPKTKVKGKEIPNSMLPTYQNVLDYHEFVRTSETGAQCEK